MSLKKDTLMYKLERAGGYRLILGRAGLDLYMSLFFTIIYIYIIRVEIVGSDLLKLIPSNPSISIIIIPIGIGLTILKIILDSKQKVMSNIQFNKKLDKGDYLSNVEFFYDFPIFITIITFISWMTFIIIWFVFVDDLTNQINALHIINITDEVLILYLLSAPFFLFSYLLFNFYYSIKATNCYNRRLIEYGEK